ncbi:hypothetical protein [Novosphingobium sp. RL4]|uniref:hypothetical protein n=1 Tax=Novosphingobium sp. RL4 TaxID=3109595 RepID=UPI002D7890C1|nr:hypothetical protein [Novosphingobium sp. RL4]WRT91888.1 hypothetical protein U9J33_11765 [Novosphingobium sp. RL4]
MATIDDALRSQVLHEFALPDHEGRIPRRRLLLASALFDWVDETDELYETHWDKAWGGRTRFEHLQQTLADFRCDERVLVGELNRVVPTKRGVWKIHSPGLRLFGWVPSVHEFVAVGAALAADVHGPNSAVKIHVQQVLTFARTHRLEGTIKMGDRRALFPPPN